MLHVAEAQKKGLDRHMSCTPMYWTRVCPAPPLCFCVFDPIDCRGTHLVWRRDRSRSRSLGGETATDG